MTSVVRIMIGLPKSGKSTFITKNAAQNWNHRVVSADSYFVDTEGNYRFDPSKLQEAHTECFRSFLRALHGGTPNIWVDNTNQTNWERSPYVMGALYANAQVRWIRMMADAETCIARPDNGHRVTEETIRRMEARYEPPLPFWPGVNEMMCIHP